MDACFLVPPSHPLSCKGVCPRVQTSLFIKISLVGWESGLITLFSLDCVAEGPVHTCWHRKVPRASEMPYLSDEAQFNSWQITFKVNLIKNRLLWVISTFNLTLFQVLFTLINWLNSYNPLKSVPPECSDKVTSQRAESHWLERSWDIETHGLIPIALPSIFQMSSVLYSSAWGIFWGLWQP